MLLGACAAPAPSPAPPAPPAAPTVAATRPAPASADAPAAASGTLRYVLRAEASEARFRARETLVGQPLPSEAVGRTSALSGAIAVDAEGFHIQPGSRVAVDLRELRSDQSRRDNYIKRNTLETDRFPTAEFVPTEVRGLAGPLPSAGEVTFQLAGELTVHGVTRPVVWDVRARLDGGTATGTATTRVTMTEFGMTPPQVGPVLSIEDAVALELDFHAVPDLGADLTQAERPRGT